MVSSTSRQILFPKQMSATCSRAVPLMLQPSQAVLAWIRDRLAFPQALGSPSEASSLLHTQIQRRGINLVVWKKRVRLFCKEKKEFPLEIKEALMMREPRQAGCMCSPAQSQRITSHGSSAGDVPSLHKHLLNAVVGEESAQAEVSKGIKAA